MQQAWGRDIHTFQSEILKEKRPFVRRRGRRNFNIEMDIKNKYFQAADWINLARNRAQ